MGGKKNGNGLMTSGILFGPFLVDFFLGSERGFHGLLRSICGSNSVPGVDDKS